MLVLFKEATDECPRQERNFLSLAQDIICTRRAASAVTRLPDSRTEGEPPLFNCPHPPRFDVGCFVNVIISTFKNAFSSIPAWASGSRHPIFALFSDTIPRPPRLTPPASLLGSRSYERYVY